jgi:hypothetical protein
MIPDMIRRILLLITALAVPILAQQPAVRSDPFAPLRFFVGMWRGEQSGEPSHGTAERTYSFVLNDWFLR